MVGPIVGMRLPVWDWAQPGADKYIYVRFSADQFEVVEKADGTVELRLKLPFTVDTDGNTTFKGDVYTAGGTKPATMTLYELAANGDGYVGFKAPDRVEGSYHLRLPDVPPGPNQMLVFGVPDENGDCQGTWVNP